jgi:hypothetical protein
VICLVVGVVALTGDSGTAPTIRTGTVTTGTVSSTVSASGNVQSPGRYHCGSQEWSVVERQSASRGSGVQGGHLGE